MFEKVRLFRLKKNKFKRKPFLKKTFTFDKEIISNECTEEVVYAAL